MPSGPPVNFIVSPLSSRAIQLGWNPPVFEHRNGEITGYAVNITNLDNETVHHFTLASISNFTVTNLEPFTPYECTVYASTVVGIGQSPAVIVVQTGEEGMLCVKLWHQYCN